MPNFDEVIKNLKHEMKNESTGHSRFQIENFIIGPQPTDYGKYKQCVLEIRSRIKSHENINTAYLEIKNNSNKSTEDLEKKSQFEILMEDIKRELYIFIDIYEELKDKINLDNREELEAAMWDEKFCKELISHVLMGGSPIPVSLAQNIWSLPDGSSSKKQLSGLLHQNAIANVERANSKKTITDNILDTSKLINKEKINESEKRNTDDK